MNILAVISGALTGTVAIAVFVWMSQISRDIDFLKKGTVHNTSILEALKIDNRMEHITKMKEMQRECVRRENYEEAQRLKGMIAEMIQSVEKEVEHFNETFGDIAELKINIFKPGK